MTAVIQRNGAAPITTDPIPIKRRERPDGSVVTVFAGGGRDGDEFTQAASLLDPAQQFESRVVVRRINDSIRATHNAQSVLKFSKAAHALTAHDEIQLCTLAHYRKGEGLDPAIRDPEEGQLKMDLQAWLKGSRGNGFAAAFADSVLRHAEGQVTLVPGRDRWVYCTSLLPRNGREWESLQTEFFWKQPYEGATLIRDVDAFALELGIDIAAGIDPMVDLKQDALDRAYCRVNGVENIICVDHGPVVYEQRSATPEPYTRSSRPADTPDPCFVKNANYKAEREYRFAIWTLGAPQRPRLHVAVSDRLRDLVSDFGDGKKFGFRPMTVSDVLRLEKSAQNRRRY